MKGAAARGRRLMHHAGAFTVTAVEIGMMSFEAAFLSHMLLPNGVSVIEHVQQQKLLALGNDQP